MGFISSGYELHLLPSRNVNQPDSSSPCADARITQHPPTCHTCPELTEFAGAAADRAAAPYAPVHGGFRTQSEAQGGADPSPWREKHFGI